MVTQPFQLVMRAGPAPGKTFELSKNEIHIGRDISNDIVISDAEVSRKHVRLVLRAGYYTLEDLGSTNGTFINDERISGPHTLDTGDVIQFGEHVVLVFETAQYDPDATVAVSPQDLPKLEREPAPMPAAPPQPQYQPPPVPAYSTQAPPPPPAAAAPPEEPAKDNRRTLIFAGCGCLLFVALCVIVPILVIDTMSWWCIVLPFLSNCP